MLKHDGDVRGEEPGELPCLWRDGVAGGGVQVETAQTLVGVDEQTQPYLGAQTPSDGGRNVTRPPLLSAGVLNDDHGVTADGVNARPLPEGVLKVVEVEDQLAGGGLRLET